MPGRADGLATLGRLEIVGRHAVEELLELLHLVVVVLLLTRHGDAGLLEQVLGGRDLDPGPQGESDRVRGARATRAEVSDA